MSPKDRNTKDKGLLTLQNIKATIDCCNFNKAIGLMGSLEPSLSKTKKPGKESAHGC